MPDTLSETNPQPSRTETLVQAQRMFIAISITRKPKRCENLELIQNASLIFGFVALANNQLIFQPWLRRWNGARTSLLLHMNLASVRQSVFVSIC